MGAFFLATLPGTYGEARRYETAAPCAGRGSEPPRCLEVVDGVVERVYDRRGGKSTDHFLDVRVGERATFPPFRQPKAIEVEDTFGSPEDEDDDVGVYDRLSPGDRVELGYWGRQLTRVTKRGTGSVETIASPVFDSSVGLTLGPLLPLLGGLGWYGALQLRRRGGSWRTKASFSHRKRSLPVAFGIGAVFGVSVLTTLMAGGVGTDIAMVVVLWVMGAAGGAGVVGVLVAVGALVRRLRD